jgi:hypothetical protein
MLLSIHSAELEECITTQRDFANCSKWWNRKSDIGHQAEFLLQKQRTLIELFLFEERECDDIVLRLQNADGRDTYCRVSVFRWMNEICRSNKELRNEGRPGGPYRYETDSALRSILRNDPNASLRTIADTLPISPETVRTHMSRIGYALKLLWWIPHALTSELKQVCFDLCLQLLPKFRAHAHDNWQHLVTGDES